MQLKRQKILVMAMCLVIIVIIGCTKAFVNVNLFGSNNGFGFSYGCSYQGFIIGSPVTLTPTFNGSIPSGASFSSFSPLPTGLQLDPTTGIISGTPTANSNSGYSINMYNSSGMQMGGAFLQITTGLGFVISDNADSTSLSTPGNCLDASSLCNLRAAFGAIAGTAASQYVILIPNGGTHVLTSGAITVSGMSAGQNISVFGSCTSPTVIDADVHQAFQNPSSSINWSLNNLQITNGNSSTPGGAISDQGSSLLSLNNMTFTNNSTSVGSGGAIYYAAGRLTINFSTFQNNSIGTGGTGGALFSSASSGTSISQSYFTGNTTSTNDGGGAVSISTGNIDIGQTTFANNSTGNNGNGGALYLNSPTGGQIYNSTFYGNAVNGTTDGGAIMQNSSTGTVALVNDTFVNNTVVLGGGGALAAFTAGNLTYTNCLFYNNTRSGVLDTCDLTSTGSLGNNIYDDGSSCFSVGSDLIVSPNEVSPLANNNSNGIAPTMALLSGAAAIGAGNETTCQSPPVNNQDGRGFWRNSRCDVGAFQYQP